MKPHVIQSASRRERMAELLTDCLVAVKTATEKSGVQLDGAERQDLAATLYIQEQRLEEMERRWPARKHKPESIDIGGNPPNSQQAADYVAQQKIAKLEAERKPATLEDQLRASVDLAARQNGEIRVAGHPLFDPNDPRPWNSSQQRDHVFQILREQLGEKRYFSELASFKLDSHLKIRSWTQGVVVYKRLSMIVWVEQKGVA